MRSSIELPRSERGTRASPELVQKRHKTWLRWPGRPESAESVEVTKSYKIQPKSNQIQAKIKPNPNPNQTRVKPKSSQIQIKTQIQAKSKSKSKSNQNLNQDLIEILNPRKSYEKVNPSS